jgi:uncharacterized protein
MARLDRDPAVPGPSVAGFAAGGFLVDGAMLESLFLTPERAIAWSPPPPAMLGIADLDPLLALGRPPEFILLGTGKALVFPPPALRRALEEKGIGLEVMDSRAAARAWGMLRGEGRWMGAALMGLDR